MISPVQPDQAAESQTKSLQLNTWKEIAAYFDRDVRTVQLWEKNEGLPVHRHTHETRSSVYAFPSELDSWHKARRAEKQIPAPPPEPVSPAPEERASWLRLPRFALAGAALAPLLLGGLTFAALRTLSALHRAMPTKPRTASAPAEPPMVAVLPFEDLSGSHPSELWVDGLTDDLISDLGRVGQIQVISRRSVLQFRDTQEPLPSIAEKLHANFVLEGSVVHRNGDAHINAQLIDAAQDRQVWSGAYTRKTDDILSLQDELAASIASAIKQQLTGTPPQVSFAQRSVAPAVRVAYLTGINLWTKRDGPSLLKAIGSFRQAIALDPRYADAYAGLANCYNLLPSWGHMTDREAFPQARAAAQLAIQLDPNSAEAYTALALETFRYEWNFGEADRLFRKAIELNPNQASAHQWYGEMMEDLGHQSEAMAELGKAAELDPLSPMIASELAASYQYAGRRAESIARLQHNLAVHPDFAPSHLDLSIVYASSGDWAKAEEERAAYTRLTGDTTALDVVRIGREWAEGKQSEARRHLDTLMRNSTNNRWTGVQKAECYMLVEDREDALRSLQDAYSHHAWLMVTIALAPEFGPLRQDPRFQALTHRVGVR